MTQNGNEDVPQSDTESAENVMWFIHPERLMSGDPVSVSVKCTECKKITNQSFIKLHPTSVEPVEPQEFMEHTRRLLCCSVCGTLTLKK